MREKITAPPTRRDGVAGWSFVEPGCEIRFLGLGTPAERDTALPVSWLPPTVDRARLRQVHGDLVLAARPVTRAHGVQP